MPDRGDASIRQPIPNEILKTIQRHCQATNDEARWLVARLSDTEMRLAEAAALAKANVNLHGDDPFVCIKPHPWRRLKTSGSQRKAPLVGYSLWAAEQAVKANNSPFMFP